MTETSGGSLRSLREGNRERLIGLLREHGSLHRAELARRAGVSRATVSTIVADLLAEAVVVEEPGAVAAQSGRRARLTLNPKAGAIVGLDFSATAVNGVVADISHHVVADGARALASGLSWSEQLDVGVELLDDLLGQAQMSRRQLVGVGLGIPGPVNWRTGEVGASSRSLSWAGAHAAAQLGERLGVPVSQDNTAHLGALAEATWGAARGHRNVVFVKASAGLSAGLVIEGRVFRGAVGATGAVGHVPLDPAGPVCPCGSRGCLELYTALPSIMDALEPMYGVLTFDRVVDMVEAGDKRGCLRVVQDSADALGRGLAGLCNVLNPDRVVIGGELARLGSPYLDALRGALDRHALPIVTEELRVVTGELGERAGALGGVALRLQETESVAVAA